MSRMGRPPNTEADFWERVEKGPDCWLWTGWTDRDGYGLWKRRQQNRRAHRDAYRFTKGPIPEGMLVCHTCDNPPCVNPDHLFLGTVADNNRDRERKGRGIRGVRAHRSKLTPAEVREIRRRYREDGVRQVDLAEEYGVSQPSISSLLRGESWAHITEAA